MRILICTQAVDRNDPVMGFFHRWIEEFANHAEKIHVICLKEGEHDLPQNVTVHSLGKERMKGPRFIKQLRYVARLKLLAWRLRNEYDSVFVHMNQEYVLIAGVIWKMFRKRIAMWRNHKMGSSLTSLAGQISHVVFYTSPSAYVATYSNSVRMPIGIDTSMFKIGSPKSHSILFLGRLDPVKRPDMFFDSLEQLSDDGVQFKASVYGEPTDKNQTYDKKTAPLVERGILSPHGSVRNDETPDIYGAHEVYVNLTPSGSFDKTIGEAMVSGCIVVTANEAMRGVLPDELVVDSESVSSVSSGIKHALQMSEQARAELVKKERSYIESEHSLALLTKRLFEVLSA